MTKNVALTDTELDELLDCLYGLADSSISEQDRYLFWSAADAIQELINRRTLAAQRASFWAQTGVRT